MRFIKRILNRIKFRNNIKHDESFNVVNGITKARNLYKELIQKAHPDLHEEQKEIAEELSQRINESKYNYDALLLLKQEIEKKLNNINN